MELGIGYYIHKRFHNLIKKIGLKQINVEFSISKHYEDEIMY